MLRKMIKHLLHPILRFSFLFVLIACMLVACKRPVLYESYQQIENKSWHKEKAYCFDFLVEDSTRSYNIDVEVRNNSFYPYQNLWLLCTIQKDSLPIVQDTINCELADNNGKWHGNGISIFQNSFSLHKGFRFIETGNYTVCIKHGMRKDSLSGIREIGLRLTHSVSGIESQEDKQ